MSVNPYQKRLSAARKRSYGVLSVFERFVQELEASASHAEAVAKDAEEKAQEYLDVSADAKTHAAGVAVKVEKLKELIR